MALEGGRDWAKTDSGLQGHLVRCADDTPIFKFQDSLRKTVYKLEVEMKCEVGLFGIRYR
jgi:hypothetical protein